jgi:hypothetical protein
MDIGVDAETRLPCGDDIAISSVDSAIVATGLASGVSLSLTTWPSRGSWELVDVSDGVCEGDRYVCVYVSSLVGSTARLAWLAGVSIRSVALAAPILPDD